MPNWKGEGKEVLSYQQLPAVFLKCHYGNIFLLQTHLLKNWLIFFSQKEKKMFSTSLREKVEAEKPE